MPREPSERPRRPTPSRRLAHRLPHRLEQLLRRIPRWLRPTETTLARRFGLATREDRLFFLLIVLVGVLAGVLGTVIHYVIDGFQHLLWGGDAAMVNAASNASSARVVGSLALGGLGVALVVALSGRSVGGQGMSTLIESVALAGGKVRARPVIYRAVAAIFTVGAGGSMGKEGPMIRLGAMIASRSALGLGLPAHKVKVLVGCGAAAGLAAAYNLPIGGALFAMEVILGNFALDIFGPIVVSSVISTLIARAIQGGAPIYATQGYRLETLAEIPAYLGLGVLGALASLLFVFGVGWGKELFARLRFLPEPLRPILGMSLVGCVALAVPEILGGGYGIISVTLNGDLPWKLLLVLAVAKLLATALTAGSGCAGGLFTPSLFFGAVLGGAYGYGVTALIPGAASPGAYATVGMAALAAGTSHAPLSAIIILFEFTGNYDLILPLMLASITASVVARTLYPYSTYTQSLHQKGIDLPYRMEEAVLAGLSVGDLAREDRRTLRPGEPYPDVVDAFFATHRQRLFVVDDERRLIGAVSLHDIKHVLEQTESLTAILAHDLMVPVDRILLEDERLHQASEVLARSDFERLPVVGRDGLFLGVLAKRDLLAVYAQEVLGRPAVLATFVSEGSEASRSYVELPPDFSLRQVPVPEELEGKTLAEARLPQRTGVRVIEIKRPGSEIHGRTAGADGERRLIPGGDTRLLAGDRLIVVGPEERVEALERGQLAAETFDEAEAHRAID